MMNARFDDARAPRANETPACTIRRGVATDADALSAFAARTFTETYAHYEDQDNLRRHIASVYAPAQQARELADRDVVTLLAHRDERLAAFAQVRRSEAPMCVREAAPIELHRLYVDSPWHGRGVSQHVLASIRDAALALGGETLWLKVWEHNARAIAFYRKSGFIDVGTAEFHVRDDRLTDRVLAMRLARPATPT
jgi:ribosomal protein S18 acetylase RimI-like enzyme